MTAQRAARGNDFLHGALELLVLQSLSTGPRHGYGVARWLESETDDALAIEEGSLYPALYRLEKKGWIEAEWGKTELGRRAKMYRLTSSGRLQLVRQTESWAVFSAAVDRVLAS